MKIRVEIRSDPELDAAMDDVRRRMARRMQQQLDAMLLHDMLGISTPPAPAVALPDKTVTICKCKGTAPCACPRE